MTAPWLTVVGLGAEGLAGLSAATQILIRQAEILAGSDRHLALIPDQGAERMVWTTPFADNFDRLAARRGRRLVVLASGDPMWFGIGVSLTRRFAPDEWLVIPHPGAFSLAAARLGWPLQDSLCLSIHGRPLEALHRHLHPGTRLLLLAEDGSSPAKLAQWLCRQGFGPSSMTVFEQLGSEGETFRSGTAESWPDRPVDDLNTIAVRLVAMPGARILSPAPGLPDDAFLHDGQLTKQEVRAMTLASLGPWPGARLWDIGAGCGSIAIEWCRAGGLATAIEADISRCGLIAQNALALGVPQLPILTGQAPAVLSGLKDRPDAIFLGGGTSQPEMLETCWSALTPGGRLVANAVTAESEARLLDWQSRMGGSLTRIALARLAPTGRFQTWHPMMPVTQYRGCKP